MRVPAIVLMVALVLPTAGALLYFVVAAADSPLFRVAFGASKVAQFALPVLALALCNRQCLRTIQLSLRGATSGLVVGVMMFGAILLSYLLVFLGGPLVHGLAEPVRSKVAGFGLDSPLQYIVLAAFLSVIHSFLEEYYWRWFVYSALRDRLSFPAAVLISSLAFAAHHVVVLHVYFPGRLWSATMPFSVAVAVGGAIWAWLYERSGCLAGPWLAHIAADVALMAIGYDLLYR